MLLKIAAGLVYPLARSCCGQIIREALIASRGSSLSLDLYGSIEGRQRWR
jgi:hypothetical protein